MEYYLKISKYKKKLQTDNYIFCICYYLSLIFSKRSYINFETLNENYSI